MASLSLFQLVLWDDRELFTPENGRILMSFGFNWIEPSLIHPIILEAFYKKCFLIVCRLISLREDIARPPRSPDFSPYEIFLCGYHNAEVFKHCPCTLDDLKQANYEKITRLSHDMLVRVMENSKVKAIIWTIKFLKNNLKRSYIIYF